MNMFNTNSTTVMQSKLLLGLGIDPRTADLTLHDEERDIPLWSMMRLIDMIPGFIVDDDGYTYSFTISKGTYVYNLSYTRKTKHGEKTLISFILIIKWLFDMKLFPTQYMAKYVKKK